MTATSRDLGRRPSAKQERQDPASQSGKEPPASAANQEPLAFCSVPFLLYEVLD